MWGSINCYAQTLPNCLTPSEAKVINTAIAERDSYFTQIVKLDSTIAELTEQNEDYKTAMVEYRKEAFYWQSSVSTCQQQKALLMSAVEKTTEINKAQKKNSLKTIIGVGLGSGAGGAALMTILLLVK